jgi:hypothetical protein
MADPVSGLEIHDQLSLTLRSFERCFSLLEGAAWLRRCKNMSASEALEAISVLLELKLIVTLTPGRWASEPSQCFLQLVPLQGNPAQWRGLVDMVLTADVPLTRKSFLFSECWCFSGTQLLDWLLLKAKAKSRSEGERLRKKSNYHISFFLKKNTNVGTLLARRLQNSGLLARVGRDGLFLDSPSTFFVWKLEGLMSK